MSDEHVSTGDGRPIGVMTILAPTVFVTASLAALVAAWSSDESPSHALLIMLALILLPSLGTVLLYAAMQRKRNALSISADEVEALHVALRPSHKVFFYVFAPGITLAALLLFRLLAGEDHFQGIASQLDFGPKDGLVDEDRNVSFTPGFNTFGHTLQGTIVGLFAHPSINIPVAWCLHRLVKALTCGGNTSPPQSGASIPFGSETGTSYVRDHDNRRSTGGDDPWWVAASTPRGYQILTILIASIFTAYPTYNLLKRWIRTADSFASSSFANNATEWAMGMLFGWSLGMFITVCVKHWALSNVFPSQPSNASQSQQRKVSWLFRPRSLETLQHNLAASFDGYEEQGQPSCGQIIAKWIRVVFGLLLWITVFAGANFFGASWNTCRGDDADGDTVDDDTSCVNFSSDSVPLEIQVGFFAIAGIGMAVAVIESHWRRIR